MFKNLRLLLALFASVAVLCTLPTTAQNLKNLYEPISIDGSVVYGKLPNGLTYYLKTNAKPEDRTEFRLVVKAGSLLEDEKQKGFAHFCEHMLFNGTKNFEKQELVKFFEKAGMKFGNDLNAYTGFDRTVYMLKLPTSDTNSFNSGMQILRDWAGSASFDLDEIEKERGVILEEWRLGRNAQQRMMEKHKTVTLYGSKLQHRFPIGDTAIVLHGAASDLIRYYKTFYRPDNMGIVLVGDFDIKAVEAKIKKLFADLTNPTEALPSVTDSLIMHPEAFKTSVATDHESPANSFNVFFKVRPVPTGNAAWYKEELIKSIALGYLNNKFAELRQKNPPPFVGAYAYQYGYTQLVNFLMLGAQFAEQGLDNAIATIATELARVKQHALPIADIDREKSELLMQYRKQQKEKDKIESERIAGALVEHITEETPFIDPDTELILVEQLLKSISPADIQAFFNKQIYKRNFALTISASDKIKDQLPVGDKIASKFDSILNLKAQPFTDATLAKNLINSKPKAQKPTKINELSDIGATIIEYKNGAKVVIKPTTFKDDEVLITGFRLGGKSQATDNELLNADFASVVVNACGVGNFSKSDLSKMLAGKYAYCTPYVGSNDEGLSAGSDVENTETALQLIYLYFANPRFNSDDAKASLISQKTRLKSILNNPQANFYNELNKFAYNNHPRAETYPTEEQIEKVDPEKAFEFYKKRFDGVKNFTFVVVGNINNPKLIEMLNTYIGSLPSGKAKAGIIDHKLLPIPNVQQKTIYKGIDPKATVAYRMHQPFEYNDANRHHLRMISSIVSIRLRNSIREEKGGVYTLSFREAISKYPTPYVNVNLSFTTDPDKLDSLINAAVQVIDGFIKSGPTAEELDIAKKQHLNEFEEEKKQNRYWLSYLESTYYYQLDPVRINKYQQSIEAITAESIKQAAENLLSTKNRMTFIQRPEVK